MAWPCIWKTHDLTLTNGVLCYTASLVGIGQVVLKKMIFQNMVNIFTILQLQYPLEKGLASCLDKLDFPLSKDALCQPFGNQEEKCLHVTNAILLFQFYLLL